VEQFRALDRTNSALRDAQKRLLSEREQERKHLAREIHDQIIQDLLGINYELEDISINKKFSPLLENYLTSIRGGIRELVVNLRRICGDLRPPTIDSLGLQAAIQSYAQEWSQRSGIEITLKLEKKPQRLLEATELSIFRIIQESLNNVWKHANASRVGISLQHTSPRMLRISIVDDGKGMQENLDLEELASAGHFGLLGISERVALLGGRLHLENIPAGGSLLVVEIPHPRMAAPA
jgi:signal transduction histidine kinase